MPFRQILWTKFISSPISGAFISPLQFHEKKREKKLSEKRSESVNNDQFIATYLHTYWITYNENCTNITVFCFEFCSDEKRVLLIEKNMVGKVCLRRKGKTLLGIVNKLLKTKSFLATPSNVLPVCFMQTFPPIIWIFTEGDGIESGLSS